MAHRLYPLLLIALLALGGCAGTPPRGGAPVAVEKNLQQTAEERAAAGDYLDAAQLYLKQATGATGARRTELRLGAAEYLARGQLWDRLENLLAGIDVTGLSPQQKTRYQLLNAELALSASRGDEALAQLQQIEDPQALGEREPLYYRLKARAYTLTGNALEAARQLIWLDILLQDPQQKLANQYQIWEQLSTLSDEALQRLRTSPPPDLLSGWMELVLIARQTRGDRERWEQELQRWRARYPDHPAQSVLLPDLRNQLGRAAERADHIAVLLPLSGRTAGAAAAIRDGLLAAYYQDPLERPRLRFYDTGGDALLSWSIYQQAIQDGAGFVVGPLLKSSIQQLADAGELPVPVLALNQTGAEDGRIREQPLYQFGLPPEDEARQAAERMVADGHRQVVALVPENAWGQRVSAAFQSRLQELGGELLASGRYAANGADFNAPIQKALLLDASKQRHRALERLLGHKLEFEPRRRQDVDAIFLLAYPRQARLLRPQLRFHHAGDLPTYSTSHVYSAAADARLDRDMDGLMFCDMPWVLDDSGPWAQQRERIERLWPDRSKRYQRLFALGFDAYQVIPWLDTLNIPGFSYFSGATGTLTLDPARHLHRQLEWARFERGLPHKLAPTPREGNHAIDEPSEEPG